MHNDSDHRILHDNTDDQQSQILDEWATSNHEKLLSNSYNVQNITYFIIINIINYTIYDI